MIVSSTFLCLLASSVVASEPSLGRRRETERRQLAKDIAVDLFARGFEQLDSEQLGRGVEEYLQNVDPGHSKTLFDWLGGSDGYAPKRTSCPDTINFIRPASGLSSVETAHVQARQTKAKFQAFLDAAHVSAATLNLNLDENIPNVALAWSGGGYRAMVSGAGGYHATTPQSSEGVSAGLSGIADTATYMAGLSGGSWLISTLLANYDGGKLANPVDLAKNLWNLKSNLIIPDEGVISNTEFYSKIIQEVKEKRDSFPTQITDYWGLSLSSHLFPEKYHPTEDPDLSLSMASQIPQDSIPYPIIVAAERRPEQISVAANATLWEFTYNEFGTWSFGGGAPGKGGSLRPGAFTPIKYMGTSLNNGVPNATESDKCWVGFENLGFVIGTSSTLFSAAYAQISESSSDSLLVEAISSVLSRIDAASNDIAQIPNPFRNWNDTDNPTANWEFLDLVDAGLTNQNIPIEPLIIPFRNVDAIVAFDNSADTTYFWPNGSALWTSYQRLHALTAKLSVPDVMPAVPDTNTFVNLGLNQHPTFFGCSADAKANTTIPIIIYVPNYPWSTSSNKSTYQLSYEDQEVLDVIDNGARTFTLNNTLSDTWSTCVACAFADRAIAQSGSHRSDTCRKCFSRWCWDGTYASNTPGAEYEPVVGSVPKFLADLGVSATPAADPSAGTNSNAKSSALSRECLPVGSMVGAVVCLAFGALW